MTDDKDRDRPQSGHAPEEQGGHPAGDEPAGERSEPFHSSGPGASSQPAPQPPEAPGRPSSWNDDGRSDPWAQPRRGGGVTPPAQPRREGEAQDTGHDFGGQWDAASGRWGAAGHTPPTRPVGSPQPADQGGSWPADPWRFGGYGSAPSASPSRASPPGGGWGPAGSGVPPPSGARPGGPGTVDTLGRPLRESRRGPGVALLLPLALVIALVAGGLGSALTLWHVGQQGGATADGDPVVHLDKAPKGSHKRPDGSVPSIAQEILPSVVSVRTSSGSKVGTGSGFVIEGGYIVTNNHVVRLAEKNGGLRVVFNDGRKAEATIVGSDATADIAVLDPQNVSNLSPVPLGNSDNMVVGDKVIAVGSPLGLAGTVTSGIVSSLNRPVMAGGQHGPPSYINAIQTDAPINPGNSGGPLVNMRGEVIGVNSAIATLGGAFGGKSGSIGVGFSIPINQARDVAQQIINKGYATHPIIGASVELTYHGQGARIANDTKKSSEQPIIVPNGPADKAGLRPGDVIVTLDHERIASAKDLIVTIRAHRAGDRVELTYRRNSATHTVTLTLKASKQP